MFDFIKTKIQEKKLKKRQQKCEDEKRRQIDKQIDQGILEAKQEFEERMSKVLPKMWPIILEDSKLAQDREKFIELMLLHLSAQVSQDLADEMLSRNELSEKDLQIVRSITR
jgi:hypothetical protein